jgi:hypothetical protein
MTSLDELIWATGLPEPSDPAEAKAYQHLIAAARAVINGRNVWWCEEHFRTGDEATCYRLTLKRIIDWKEEETE